MANSHFSCHIKAMKVGWRGAKTNLSISELSLSFNDGLMLPIMGQSGGGKSTLMMVLAALKWPLQGSIRWTLPGEPRSFAWNERGRGLSNKDAAHLRRCCFGFAFQRSTLTPDLQVKWNLIYPVLFMNKVRHPAFRHASQDFEHALSIAETALAEVFLPTSYLDKFPAELSGGEQQRVALAQAILHGPQVVFADEPTGSLDPVTRLEVMDVLKHLAHSKKMCVIWVTHHGETDLNNTKARKVLLVDKGEAVLLSAQDYYRWEEARKKDQAKRGHAE